MTDNNFYKIITHLKEDKPEDYGQQVKQYKRVGTAIRKANQLFDSGRYDKVEIVNDAESTRIMFF